MAAYFLRRFLYAILTFFGITLVTFTLIHAVPGDPNDPDHNRAADCDCAAYERAAGTERQTNEGDELLQADP